MDFPVLIDTYYECRDQDKMEILDEMIKTILTQESVILPNLKRAFLLIQTLLENRDVKFLRKANILLELMIGHIVSSEMEINFKIIFEQLVLNLGDADQQVRQQSEEIIINYIKQTRNLQNVIQALIQYGFSHSNFFIRERCIHIVPQLIDAQLQIFTSKSGLKDVRQLLELVMVSVYDSTQSVSEKAQQTVIKIRQRKYQNFDNAFRRLSGQHQSTFHQIIDEHQKQIQEEKFISINIGDIVLDDNENFKLENKELYQNFMKNDLPTNQQEILQYFPKDQQTNLYFGILKEQTLLDSFYDQDIKVVINAVQQLNEVFNMTGSLDESKPHMMKFFKYLCFLLQKDSYHIENVILNILLQILNIPGIHVSTYLPLALPILIEKLQDDKVLLRQKVVLLLRKLMRVIKQNTLLKNFMLFIENQSWHVKEELLHLICYLFIETDELRQFWYLNAFRESEEGAGMPNSINFQEILTKIAALLDDQVPQVRKAALETLTVIANGTLKPRILEILFDIVHQKVYGQIIDKLQKGLVYFIAKSGNLQLPAIEIKKHEKQKDQYEEKLQQYQLIMQKLDQYQKQQAQAQEAEQQQEEIKENLKTQESRRPPPQVQQSQPNLNKKEKIVQANQRFQNLVYREKMGIDTTKYDIIVPFNDIPMANGDPFGNIVFQNNQNLDKQRELQMENQSQIQQNLYFYQSPEPPEENKEESKNLQNQNEDGGEEQKTNGKRQSFPQPYELQYNMEQKPLDDLGEGRVRHQQINVNDRVKNNIRELNDQNGDEMFMNIPKVIQFNAQEYKSYQYEKNPQNNESQMSISKRQASSSKEKLHQFSDDNSDEFFSKGGNIQMGDEQDEDEGQLLIDTNAIKMKAIKDAEEQKIRKKKLDDQLYQQQQKEYLNTIDGQQSNEYENAVLQGKQQELINPNERYQQNLEQFLAIDEDNTFKPQKQQKPAQQQQGKNQQSSNNSFEAENQEKDKLHPEAEFGITIYEQQQLMPLELPNAELQACILNVQSTSWRVQYNSITTIRNVIYNDWELLFQDSGFDLMQTVQDMISLADSTKIPVAINALMCVGQIAHALKSGIDPCVDQMFTVVFRRSLDPNEYVADRGKQALGLIANYCHEEKILNLIVKKWDNKLHSIKEILGVMVEKIIVRLGQNIILYQENYEHLLAIIASMVLDPVVQVRRQGKKTFFQLLSTQVDQNDLIRKLNRLSNYQQTKLMELYEAYMQIHSEEVNKFEGKQNEFETYVPSSSQSNRFTARPNSHLLQDMRIKYEIQNPFPDNYEI